jgi:hypothetical protein
MGQAEAVTVRKQIVVDAPIEHAFTHAGMNRRPF